MIWSTMLKSKAIFITCALIITASFANAQTIGDIAAHQRAKAQSELKGESPDKPSQATAAIWCPAQAKPDAVLPGSEQAGTLESRCHGG